MGRGVAQALELCDCAFHWGSAGKTISPYRGESAFPGKAASIEIWTGFSEISGFGSISALSLMMAH
jgi:hypothetical protein